jgi:hypothetical protein
MEAKVSAHRSALDLHVPGDAKKDSIPMHPLRATGCMRNENNVTKISVWKHVTTNLDLFFLYN